MPRAKRKAPRRTTKRTRTTPARRGRVRPTSRRSREAPIEVPRGWTVGKDGRSISREVKTKDFLEAVDLINAIAPVAEKLEHHPDLHLERWNHLRITTYSHDVGHLTDRDERLAARINGLLDERAD